MLGWHLDTVYILYTLHNGRYKWNNNIGNSFIISVSGLLCGFSYVDLPGYSAMMGTLFRDPVEGEPGVQTIPLTKIVCGPSESQLVLLQLEQCVFTDTH